MLIGEIASKVILLQRCVKNGDDAEKSEAPKEPTRQDERQRVAMQLCGVW